ncbi:SpoIIE family protein phosphatase [bacterium]|nr:SpoIIE family protein phosphatase [bacterium]
MTLITPKASRAHRSRLVIETGEQVGMIFPLSGPQVTIGRGPDNQIQIIDPRMSRNHTLLVLRDDGWYIRDRGSKNGSLLNAKLVEAEAHLTPGDRIQIGETIFVFERDGEYGADSTGTGMRVCQDHEPVIPRHIVKLSSEDTPVAPRLVVRSDDAERLSIIYKVMDLTSTLLDVDELMERVVELIEQSLEPDRVGILLYDQEHAVLLPKLIRRPASSNEDIIISNSIISQAISDQVALLVGDASTDNRFNIAESIATQQIHSAICAPLMYKNTAQGVIYLDRRRTAQGYTEDDLRLVGGIANQTSIALANSQLHRQLLEQHAHDRELAIARTIQEHLLPRAMPEISGFEIFGFNRPARMVGGDYFDVIPLPDGRMVLAVADVSGKGVPAAILLAEMRTAVQLEMRGLVDNHLCDLMERLNQLICRDSTDNMFVTLMLGVLDPAERRFTYCNAGHVYPLLRAGDGRITTLETGGCLLGVIPGAVYEQDVVDLPPGTMLLIYSDGVTDTMNGQNECFGTQRLIDMFGLLGNQSAEQICRRIDEAALDFSSGTEPFDDFTLLVTKSLE